MSRRAWSSSLFAERFSPSSAVADLKLCNYRYLRPTRVGFLHYIFDCSRFIGKRYLHPLKQNLERRGRSCNEPCPG